jgi:hypothetical protein
MAREPHESLLSCQCGWLKKILVNPLTKNGSNIKSLLGESMYLCYPIHACSLLPNFRKLLYAATHDGKYIGKSKAKLEFETKLNMIYKAKTKHFTKSSMFWDIIPCIRWNSTYASAEHLQGRRTATWCLLHVGFFLDHTSILKIEAACTSETSADFHRSTRRRYNSSQPPQ